MSTLIRHSKSAIAAAVVAVGLAGIAAPAAAEPVVGLVGSPNGSGTALITFDSASPGTATSPVVVVGLAGDAHLVGIDLRPTTGLLYGVGNAGGLYTLNAATGAATKVGQLTVGLSGTSFGVDFNPVPDLAGLPSLRITSDTGQNLRVNVNPGMIGVTATDTPLNGAANGAFASAYTNNDIDPATGTFLYDIFVTNGDDATLFQQNPANAGTLIEIGDLGFDLTSTFVGFDVSSTGASFASLATITFNGLYSVDLGTGAASLLGSLASVGNVSVIDITALTAPIPEPETYALMLAGLAGLGAYVRRRARKAD